MRDAPSLAIVAGLQDAGAVVRAYDPEGMEHARTMMQGVAFADNPYLCAEGAHALVIVTEWNAFRALDLTRLCQSMVAEGGRPVLIDLRNVYNLENAERHGFLYEAVGRATSVRVK